MFNNNSRILKTEKRIVNIGIHIAAWVCFFLLPYIFSTQQRETSTILSKYFFTHILITNLFLLLFYYFNTLYLIPKYLFKKKWIIYTVIVTLCLLIFNTVPKHLTHFANNTTEQKLIEEFREEIKQKFHKDSLNQQLNKPNEFRKKNISKPFRYFPGSFVVFLLILTIGICISLAQQWHNAEKLKEQIKNEKLNTELSFLKTQINPHFFFNTLNNIYSLSVSNSNQTPSAILKLSSIMRYVLTETQQEKVLLEKEIDFIKNFIDLQLVRLTDKTTVNFTVDGAIENKYISPLLFITFIENAFKYGVSTKDNTFISINLKAQNNSITFTVDNSIILNSSNLITTTGIGINNVKRRLELSYPNKHTLQVSDTDNIFKVLLEINLE